MVFSEWVTNYLRGDIKDGLRVGQSYMNRVRPAESNPDIFYEIDEKRVWEKIRAIETLETVNPDKWSN